MSFSYLSANSYIKIANDYIPAGTPISYKQSAESELTVEEHIEQYLNLADNKLRIMGSEEDFKKNLDRYGKFPGAHHFFRFDICEPYSTIPPIYESTKSRKFIHKGSFHVFLQNMVLEKFKLTNNKLARAIIACFLKNDELKYTNWERLVEYSTTVMDIKNDSISVFLTGTLQQMEHGIKYILPFLDNVKDYPTIYRHMSQEYDVIHHVKSPRKREKYGEILHTVREIVEFLEESLRRWDKLEAPCDNVLVIYEDADNGNRLIMKSDLDVNQVEEQFLSTVKADTLENDEETITIPINRAHHCASPVLTRSGEFCKLAVDVLFELFYDLFCGHKIFQKIKKSEWRNVVYFFDQLKPFFDLEKKSPYFILEKDFRRIFSTPKFFFSEYLNRTTKEFRKLKQKFTSEVLKKELIFLGLTEIFPDVLTHVKEVSDHVQRGKHQKDMKTLDLIEAVQLCMLRSLCEKIPFLPEFIHNQNGCYRLPNCPCCTTPQPSSRYRFSNTRWKEVLISSVEALYEESGASFIDYLNTQLHYNCETFKTVLTFENIEEKEKDSAQVNNWQERKKNRLKVFLIDYDDIQSRMYKDLESWEDMKEIDDWVPKCESVEEFWLVTKPKNLYLRTFSNTVFNTTEDRWVFAEEALDMIPILLMKQRDLVDLAEIAKYQEKWPQGCNVTLNLKELEVLLNEFDVNKELLTLIPDLKYAFHVKIAMKTLAGFPVISVFSPSRELVMDNSQAHFHIFQSVICDVDWRKEVCWEPENSKKMFRKAIIDEMKALGDGLVLKEDVDKAIGRLKQHPNYLERQSRKLLTTLIKLYDADLNDSISFSFFESECRAHGIECYQPQSHSLMELDNLGLPVWKARLLFVHFWITMFFKTVENEDEIERNIRMALLHKVPITHWTHESNFTDLIFSQDRDLFYDSQDIALEAVMQNTFIMPEPRYHSWLADESYKDRTYIKRGEIWKIRSEDRKGLALNDEELAVREAQRKKILAKSRRNDAIDMEVLRKMIGNQAAIRNRIRDIFRAEDLKLFGTDKPQEAMKMKMLKEQLRNRVEEEKKREVEKRPVEDVKEEVATQGKEELEIPDVLETPKSCETCQQVIPQFWSQVEAVQREQKKYNERLDRVQEHIGFLKLPNNGTTSEGTSVSSEPKEVMKQMKLELDEMKLRRRNYFKDSEESANCKKCSRTGERCDKVTGELKSAVKREKKLKRKLGNCEKKVGKLEEQIKQMVPRKELEEKVEEMEKVRKDAEDREKELREGMGQLERRLEVSDSAIEQLTREKTDAEACSSDKDRIILALRNQLFPETLAGLDVRLSVEMRRILVDLQNRQDDIISRNPIRLATKTVQSLMVLTRDPDVLGRADYDLREFHIQFGVYEGRIRENIRLIQTTPFMIASEVPPVLEEPTLPPRFYNALREAQEARNQELENECMICKRNDEEWFFCPGCNKKFGIFCIHNWFITIDKRECPHCMIIIPE